MELQEKLKEFQKLGKQCKTLSNPFNGYRCVARFDSLQTMGMLFCMKHPINWPDQAFYGILKGTVHP